VVLDARAHVSRRSGHQSIGGQTARGAGDLVAFGFEHAAMLLAAAPLMQ